MTTVMRWVLDDGGRAAAGYTGRKAGDCSVRAIAISVGLPYQQVYDDLHDIMRAGRRDGDPVMAKGGTSPRDGTPMPILRSYLDGLGWVWRPTMSIGAGTTVHLCADELPAGRLIVRCSKHLVAVVDRVIRDTHDPSREGRRCVYGYWQPRLT